MMMFIKLGYRNLWRNTRRTVLTALVIGISLAALMVSRGMMLGITDNMVNSITRSMIGEGKISHPKFRQSMKAEYLLDDPQSIAKRLSADPRVKAFAPRTMSFAMIAAPKGMTNVIAFGIDPERETGLSRLAEQVVDGAFVESDNSLMVGKGLLKKLGARLGDKVVVTMTEAKTGSVSQELMRISGVVATGARQLDDKTAYLHIAKTRKLLAVPEGTHEFALAFHDRATLELPSHPFWQEYSTASAVEAGVEGGKKSQSGIRAESWRQMMASFVAMMKAGKQSQGLAALILMILVGITITNTLFMALYERMFEFAVLQAVGTKAREIVTMILAEAFFLAIISLGVAAVAWAIAAVPLGIWGLDFRGVELSDVTVIDPIFYQPDLYQFTVLPVAAVLFVVAVAVYPAIYASRLKIASALKRSF